MLAMYWKSPEYCMYLPFPSVAGFISLWYFKFFVVRGSKMFVPMIKLQNSDRDLLEFLSGKGLVETRKEMCGSHLLTDFRWT